MEDDIVCSCMKVRAGVLAHRDSLTNYLDKRFDGDAVNVSIALDRFMSDKWYPLEPMFNIMQLSKPGEVSGNIAIPKPEISTISSWLSS